MAGSASTPTARATVFTGKIELGQGILTALAQIAAEELDLPLARIKMISGDTGQTPNEGQTAGSQSVENSGTALRMAGAEVRAILLDLAAKRLGVAGDQLTVADGVITAPDGRKVTYGELAATVDLKREASAKSAPKPPASHKIVGKSIPRLDIPKKVTGGAVYRAGHPPARHGARPRGASAALRLDARQLRRSRGQGDAWRDRVVRDGSFLGVVAEREEQAIKARDALAKSAKWTAGPELPDPARIFDVIKSLPSQDSTIGVKQASVPANARTFEAVYTKPYMAHASIGPSCAVAEFKDGKMTVWTHSQGVFPLRGELVKALKMPASAVRCIHTEGSGCYGHNGADDVALDAALLARALPGRPVRLQWMRDDEFNWEPYGPAMVMRAKAALADGKIADWEYELWSNTHSTRPASTTGTNVLAAWYLAEPQKMGPPSHARSRPAAATAMPSRSTTSRASGSSTISSTTCRSASRRCARSAPMPTSSRSKSFMDELAAAAGADPVAFRLRTLKDPRARAVIEAAAKLANWKPGESERRPARPRHRFLQVQEPRLLRGRGGRGRGRPRDRRGAGAAHLGGGRFRPDRQSGRTVEPDRRRHRAVGELDAEGGGAVRQERHPRARLGRAIRS